MEGLDKGKAAVIITARPKEVCAALSGAFGSGVTLWDARGYYSNEPRTVIYFVVNRFQIGKMKQLVHENDAGAFVSITEISDVFGSGSDQAAGPVIAREDETGGQARKGAGCGSEKAGEKRQTT